MELFIFLGLCRLQLSSLVNKAAYKTAQFRLFVIFFFCISEKKNDCCREKMDF